MFHIVASSHGYAMCGVPLVELFLYGLCYACLCVAQALGEPLYRVSTGNYEYRLILRCRQEARSRFAKMRKDVLEKIELLDQKHGTLAQSHLPS